MNRKPIARSLSILLFAAIIMLGSAGNARSWPFRKDRHYRILRRMPAGHVRILSGKKHYYYHRGLFYRKTRSGFLLVSPPIGVTVPMLPEGCSAVFSRGRKYFYHEDAFYRKSPSGYIVITEPGIKETAMPKPINIDTTPPPEAVSDIFIVNIPNNDGSYTPVKLVKKGDGYTGPQGEFYPGKPTIEQLKVLYGKD